MELHRSEIKNILNLKKNSIINSHPPPNYIFKNNLN
jgi:hypothetical protein